MVAAKSVRRWVRRDIAWDNNTCFVSSAMDVRLEFVGTIWAEENMSRSDKKNADEFSLTREKECFIDRNVRRLQSWRRKEVEIGRCSCCLKGGGQGPNRVSDGVPG